MSKQKVLEALSILRNAHPVMRHVFTRGACFELWKLLRLIDPSVLPYYSYSEGHVYVKIGTKFYDIKGEHPEAINEIRGRIRDSLVTTDTKFESKLKLLKSDDLRDMRYDHELMHDAHSWHRRSHDRKLKEAEAALTAESDHKKYESALELVEDLLYQNELLELLYSSTLSESAKGECEKSYERIKRQTENILHLMRKHDAVMNTLLE